MSAEETKETPKDQKPEQPVEEVLPQPRPDELPAVLEALLFAATSPLNMKRLNFLTGGVDKELIDAALGDLRERYESRSSGLMLMEVAGGYQLATRPEVADWVLALHKHRKKNPISPAVMETLAIVAYKQPLVRAEVEAIRGVDCGGVMRALQDAGLIEVVGHKEVVGRPSLYGTTETFLKTFGLKNLEELPSLADLQRIISTQMKGSEEEGIEVEESPAEEDESRAEAPVENEQPPQQEEPTEAEEESRNDG